MAETLHTAFRLSEYEIRSDGDGRTLSGIAVPFDMPTRVGPIREVFRRGAFAKTVRESKPNKVKLYLQHDDTSAAPIGAASRLTEHNDGLHADMRVARTRAGDEALSLVQDGVLDSFSVGFIPVRSTKSADGIVERREVRLMEISLVAHPAYEDARVLSLRDASSDNTSTMTLAQARLIATQLKANTPTIGTVR